MSEDFAKGILYCLAAMCLMDALRGVLMWWHERRVQGRERERAPKEIR